MILERLGDAVPHFLLGTDVAFLRFVARDVVVDQFDRQPVREVVIPNYTVLD